MSCGDGHLGFLIGIQNRNLVKDIPMIIHLQFGFSQFISFREEDLWNFSQSEHIIGPGSHVEYPTGMKNRNFVEDHPRNIPAKFGSNWPSGFGEEAWNVKSLQSTDAKWWQFWYIYIYLQYKCCPMIHMSTNQHTLISTIKISLYIITIPDSTTVNSSINLMFLMMWKVW